MSGSSKCMWVETESNLLRTLCGVLSLRTWIHFNWRWEEDYDQQAPTLLMRGPFQTGGLNWTLIRNDEVVIA